MLKIIRATIIPLISLFIFVLGNGLFTTLLVLRMHLENTPSVYVGAMTSAYYLGLVIGSFQIEKLILQVGHIRVFAAFASLLAVICIMHGLIFNIPLWIFMRLVGGFATAGLFVVIESWLLVSGSVKMRGQVLSLYMVTFYAAQASGQFFIDLGNPKNLELFAVAAMLSSLSVIPLSITKSRQPQISEPSALSFYTLYKRTGSGVISSLVSGLILSAIYGLLPWFIIERSQSTAHVSTFMAAVIFGGMALQYPIGHLSDHVERRMVLIGLTIAIAAVSLLALVTFQDAWISLVIMFLFGGMTFTLYPLSISHACDSLDHDDIISGTQGLLLAYSIGATLGPLFAPAFISVLGPRGLFIYFMTCSLLLTVFLVWRRLFVPSRAQEEPYRGMPQTTPITAELDPRGEEN